MSDDLLSQKKVWNFRAAHWDNWGFGEPLCPCELELEYQKKFVKSGNQVLVLGATKGLCEAMLSVTKSVTSVDFSQDAINEFRVEGVNYVCRDWITYLENNTKKFDNIVTDNGLFCLEFPKEWGRIIEAIHSNLKQGGVFCSRFFLSNQTAPKSKYSNPNLSRIMPSMGKAAECANWTVVKPPSGTNDPYPARYVFPPKRVVKDIFWKYALVDEFIPTYDEGEHFETMAFQKK